MNDECPDHRTGILAQIAALDLRSKNVVIHYPRTGPDLFPDAAASGMGCKMLATPVVPLLPPGERSILFFAPTGADFVSFVADHADRIIHVSYPFGPPIPKINQENQP